MELDKDDRFEHLVRDAVIPPAIVNLFGRGGLFLWANVGTKFV